MDQLFLTLEYDWPLPASRIYGRLLMAAALCIGVMANKKPLPWYDGDMYTIFSQFLAPEKEVWHISLLKWQNQQKERSIYVPENFSY